MTSYIYDMVDTWNAGATTFTAVKMNVTDTASNAASLLMDLQVGGSSRFNVGKTGSLKLGVSPTGTDQAGTNVIIAGSQGTGTGAGGSIIFQVAPAGSTGTLQNGLATFVEMTSTRAFNLYNTTDVTTNFERGKIAWSSNVLQIGTEKAGTGTARALEFQTDGTTRLTLDTSGNVVIPLVDNSTSLRLGGSSSGTTLQVDEDGSLQIRRLNSTSFGLSVGTRGGGAAPSLGVGASTLLAFASINQPDGDSTYDVVMGRRTAGVMYLTGNATGASLEFVEMTAPAAPAADNVRIYAEDNGSGKTRLMALFATGAAVQIAIEP